jgi:BirA family transcriptional regulator, biotin operon repressor / biotin---[acetyl-CoA-carboxylase] ligase
VGIDGLNSAAINSKVSQYWSVIIVEETTSTQSELAANFSQGNVLVAEYQSSGRGRLDRKFEVPPRKGLTFSIAFNSDFWRENQTWIPLLTGSAVAKAINSYGKRNLVKVKWPNDLIVNDLKLGGILSESRDGGFIVGIGINIFQSSEELPIQNATSLSAHLEVNREELLIEILNQLGVIFRSSDSTMAEAFSDLKNEYRNLCETLGKQVLVTLPGSEILEDVAIAISEEGSLLLKTREIRVADIVHLR